jgi:hypothetical protein
VYEIINTTGSVAYLEVRKPRTRDLDFSDCAGEVRFIAAVLKRDAIEAILGHLKIEGARTGWDTTGLDEAIYYLLRGPPEGEAPPT